MIAWLRSATGISGLGLVLLATAIIAVTVFLLLAGAYRDGRRAEEADDLERMITTQERIRDADAHGPRTPGDVDRRLRDGRF